VCPLLSRLKWLSTSFPITSPYAVSYGVIAQCCYLPIGALFLDAILDAWQQIDACIAISGILTVRSRQTSGTFTVFVSDRFFDLKQCFRESFGPIQFTPFIVHFFIYGIEPDDCATISRP
jgi:hypothetical protein